MTDYITIIINDKVIEKLAMFWLILMIIVIIYLFIDMLSDMLKKSEEEKKRKIAEPYKRKYEELQRQKKYKEASEFYIKHRNILSEVYYY